MESSKKTLRQWTLLLLSSAALCIGTIAGPLLLRFYFLHGGTRKWLSAWLETGGWPLLIIPIWLSSHNKQSSEGTHVTPKLCLASIVLGVLTGLDDFLYAWGVSYLPLSTLSLLIASHLGFTAVFAFFIVKHKFSSYSINAIILLTMGSFMLTFHVSGDRPEGVTAGQYWLGFIVTVSAAALYGLILPLTELVYKKATHPITYTLAMEMQVIMSFSATVLCTIGMVVNKDFEAIGREARAFDLGEFNYYMALVWNAVCWQLFFIGVFGVIFLSSSLMSGVIIAACIPVTELLAVILYHEKFSAEKGMALAMALWGFASYLYGEYMDSKLQTSNMPEEHPQGSEHAEPREEEERTLELVVEELNSNSKSSKTK
ncbi:hypothetical protein SUGI_0138360 [Cryptomeria japonica]|uniref:purine permease 3 n=1 Tax=Cryptomeria japonica TaxID=3369 RepID=UPI002408B745|nr:purine permease 3 [Cryptomeria japonica]GLJ10935.1 hypothetical protein SUGI_0138360 [Cryptomeria japonica]